jgi:hypothetical protein
MSTAALSDSTQAWQKMDAGACAPAAHRADRAMPGTSGSGQGIVLDSVHIPFRISGDDQPKVSTNPLSVLAPGILPALREQRPDRTRRIDQPRATEGAVATNTSGLWCPTHFSNLSRPAKCGPPR